MIDSLTYDSKRLMSSMASLGEIAVYAPSIFETKHKYVIRDFLVKDLLLIDRVRYFQSLFNISIAIH